MKRCLAAIMAVLLLLPTARAESAKPELSAASAILVDADSGRVLYQKNADEKRLIASITKLMTALVAVESTQDLSREVTVERADTLTEGSSMYLQIGEKISLETLLYGLLLSSGNDAALAIARNCAGDVETFVEWMNQRCESLGMKNSHFANPNGLNDDTHYSTAADMAKVAIEVMQNETLAKIVGTKSITLGTRTFTNHNKLLWQYDGCEGMKTGYTEKAGRTLVSCARRDGQLLVAVTLNDPNDWADHAKLFDYGFSSYPRQVLALAGKSFRQVPITGSLVRFVTVRTAADVFFPTTENETIEAKIELPSQVKAPVNEGEIAGSLSFWMDGTCVGETYLVFSSDVRRDTAGPAALKDKLMDFFAGAKETSALAVFSQSLLTL